MAGWKSVRFLHAAVWRPKEMSNRNEPPGEPENEMSAVPVVSSFAFWCFGALLPCCFGLELMAS